MIDARDIVVEKVFVVYGGGTDRSPPGIFLGICSSKESAMQLAEGKGWWGGNGSVREEWALPVMDDGKVKYMVIGESDPTLLLEVKDDLAHAEKLDRIKAKLTEDEWHFLRQAELSEKDLV